MCRAFDIVDPCSHLWCGHEAAPLVCKSKKGPPLEGTECGFGKVILQKDIKRSMFLANTVIQLTVLYA